MYMYIGLLTMNDSQRLGATSGGVTELKESPFFKDIDFGKVDRKELPPPFLPDVSGELDTKYVPKGKYEYILIIIHATLHIMIMTIYLCFS